MRAWAALLVAAVAVSSAAGATDTRELRFVRQGKQIAALSVDALAKACGAQTVAIDDPYYGRRVQFRACPLAAVIQLGFGQPATAFAGDSVIFRAQDGYAKPASGARLAEPGGWIAFADAEHMRGDDPGWQPIDRKQVDPGPFYLVWSGAEQHDATLYPWPYQLVTIELASLDTLYPHIAPSGTTPDSPAQAGYAIFRGECIACHAINGEGGTIAPDLNVPQSIVEYRPAAQIKAYIRNPLAFRYTSMPAHPNLTDRQLDDLIAYFSAMKDRKRDPGRTP
ncbi:MAG: cytochrome c [bacterium]